MQLKQFVKVYESENEAAPYYIQWAVWCWRKPIWIGLPLIWVAGPIMVVDVIWFIVTGLVLWAKHR